VQILFETVHTKNRKRYKKLHKILETTSETKAKCHEEKAINFDRSKQLEQIKHDKNGKSGWTMMTLISLNWTDFMCLPQVAVQSAHVLRINRNPAIKAQNRG
jgi:hypothetical protein